MRILDAGVEAQTAAGRVAVRRIADRLVGSPEIFGHEDREPEQSVNFVTCHDGFTLNDLVSYNSKHNEANGEGNRDGDNNNFSDNYGVEGPTKRADIEAFRARQIRNILSTLLLSQGVPMLLAASACFLLAWRGFHHPAPAPAAAPLSQN